MSLGKLLPKSFIKNQNQQRISKHCADFILKMTTNKKNVRDKGFTLGKPNNK